MIIKEKRSNNATSFLPYVGFLSRLNEIYPKRETDL